MVIVEIDTEAIKKKPTYLEIYVVLFDIFERIGINVKKYIYFNVLYL